MKLFPLLSLFSVLPLSAQHLTDARWSDDSLHLGFSLVEDRKAGSDYAIWATPVLTDTKGHRLDLPVSIFRGKRNQQLHERQQFYQPQTLRPLPVQGKACEGALGDTIDYQLSFDRRTYPWLWEDSIRLDALREAEGCCQVDSLPASPVAQLQYRAPFFPVLLPVEDNTGKAGELQRDNPVLQHISQYRPYDDTRVMYKEKGALWVHFELDRHRLLHQFRDNAATLDRIVDITRQILADTTSTVKLIQIIGMASVEGPADRNMRLAANRAEALKGYIQSQIHTPDSLYELANGGEAWTELRAAIVDNDLPYKQEMLDLIDQTPDPNVREQKLKALHDGQPYAQLRDHILGDQRNSGYLRIYYDYVPDKVAPVINRATERLQEASAAHPLNRHQALSAEALAEAERALAADARVAEALRLLLSVRHDARSYNALGVAYWYAGHRREAEQYFEKAAQNGNAQAKDNLQQALEVKRQK